VPPADSRVVHRHAESKSFCEFVERYSNEDEQSTCDSLSVNPEVNRVSRGLPYASVLRPIARPSKIECIDSPNMRIYAETVDLP
jgi:hypothetical protein